MKRILPAAAALVGFILGVYPACAQIFTGMAGIEANSVDVNGNKAKYFEYSDPDSFKAKAKIDLLYDTSSYFLGLQAKDPGYDTQHYRLDGGAYGKFKYWIDYDEILHNITFDAKTFYRGAGSDRLTGSPNPDPRTWSDYFDYFTKRKRVGTGFDLVAPKPFFLNVSYMHEDKDGVRPVGVSTGSTGSPFGGTSAASLELPVPIDYRTDGFTVEGGYAKKPFFLSFVYSLSEFRNGSEDLTFTPIGTSSGVLSLPPDNTSYKLGMKGGLDLPLNSRLNINLGDGRTTSDATIFSRFDGKIDTRNFDFQLASRPLSFLDTKLFYRYYERDNKSSGEILVGANLVTTVPLSYQTNTYGLEAGLQLPAKLRLDAGYKYVDTDRRIRFLDDPALALPHNKDDIYSANLKWSRFDFLTAKVGYEYLRRSADYRTAESNSALNRQFAYAAQNRDTLKAGVDISPSDAFNTGVEYQYKKSNYRNTAFGYTADVRHAWNLNADYAVKKIARLYGYLDYEHVRLDQRGLVSGSVWESRQQEKTYGYGVRSDVFIIPKKLTLTLQYDYLQSNGNNDFGFFDNAIWANIGVPVGSSVNIPSWDDYRRHSIRLAGAYQWSERLTTKLGYAYERYKYSDAQINGYRYFVDGAGSSAAYLTGAYNRPSYSANVVFLSMLYRF